MVMEPWLYGQSAGVSQVALLVSAAFWTWLWAPVGLLLATPLAVCLVVVGKHVPELDFITVLLADEPVLNPDARFYQRLLAADVADPRKPEESGRGSDVVLRLSARAGGALQGSTRPAGRRQS
jgi:hypothetical protein